MPFLLATTVPIRVRVPERLESMIPDRMQEYMDLLRPFVLVPSQYAWAFAPDNHYDFPIHGSLRDGTAFPPGTDFALLPVYRDPAMLTERVLHYGREVLIMSPLISIAAKMLFLMFSEAVPFTPSPIFALHHTPALGVGPTLADMYESDAIRGVKLYEPGTWNTPDAGPVRCTSGSAGHTSSLTSISAAFDNGWARLTECLNPYRELSPKRTPYTLGSMSGMFAGRIGVSQRNVSLSWHTDMPLVQQPDAFYYALLARSTTMPPLEEFPRVTDRPVYVRFHEHHCINPATPVPTGGLQPGFDDGLSNAYLPRGFSCVHAGNSLLVNVPGIKATLRYEDYVKGRPNSHNPATCGDCLRRKQEDEAALHERIAARSSPAEEDDQSAVDAEEDVGSVLSRLHVASRSRRPSASSQESNVSYIYGDLDDPSNQVRSRQITLERDPVAEAILDEMMSEGLPDDYEDHVESECNGVSDVIITGEVRATFECLSVPLLTCRCRPCGVMPRRGTTSAGTDACADGTAWSSSYGSPSITISLPAIPSCSADTSSETRTSLDRGVRWRITRRRCRWRAPLP